MPGLGSNAGRKEVRFVEVANIDDPSTELNALSGSFKGMLLVAYESGAGTDERTLYSWDDAGGAESVPQAVDGSSGLWVAVGGKYVSGVTATQAELNYLDITTLGAAEPSKVLTSDAQGNTDMNGGKLSNVNIVSYQGVSWNESTDAYTRRGSLTGLTASASPDNDFLPIQGAMRRCVLSAAGEVQYYLDPDDSTLKVNGDAANLDGTDGQVMVEVPLFYYRYAYGSNTHNYDISTEPLDGFFKHPAFFKNGEWVDYRYVGAYEGIAYDNGASAYNDGTGAASTNFNGGTIDTANDKLGSVSGFKPVTDETRAEFRAIAGNVGTGWRIDDPYLRHAINLLMLVEYADFNMQSVIGTGNTSYASFDYTESVGDTGYSNGDGNGTNASDTAAGTLAVDGTDTNDGTTQKEYMTYRGIENWYGSLWQFMDGLNIHNFDDNAGTAYSRAYASNNDSDFADDVSTNYDEIADIAEAEGYQDRLEQVNGLFLPASVGATSTTKVADYYYTDFDSLTAPFDEWRVALVGGSANNDSQAGAFTLSANSGSATDAATVGARLSF